LATLAQELGMEDAKNKFKRLFLTRENPYLITSCYFEDGVEFNTR